DWSNRYRPGLCDRFGRRGPGAHSQESDRAFWTAASRETTFPLARRARAALHDVMKQLPPEEWGSEGRKLLPNDRRYLVGVSGGRDSIVLLHWLLARGYRKLIICHLEHGLRGPEGKADAGFVERLASKHRLSAEVGTADVAALAAQRKQSIETAAREARL